MDCWIEIDFYQSEGLSTKRSYGTKPFSLLSSVTYKPFRWNEAILLTAEEYT